MAIKEIRKAANRLQASIRKPIGYNGRSYNDAVKELDDRCQEILTAIDSNEQEVRQTILREWADGEFRDAANDDQKLLAAAAVMKVAQERGVDPLECISYCVSAFVLDLIDPEILESMSP